MCLVLIQRRLDSDAALVWRQPMASHRSVALRHSRRRGRCGGGAGLLWGIPRSHHFSTLPSTAAPCLYTHKSACHFYCWLLCSQGDVFSLLVPSLFLFCFSFFPSQLSGSSCPPHLERPSEVCPPTTHSFSLDLGGRLGCLVMAT